MTDEVKAIPPIETSLSVPKKFKGVVFVKRQNLIEGEWVDGKVQEIKGGENFTGAFASDGTQRFKIWVE